MKLRHAAALSLMGWYLMVPPPTGPQAWNVKDAPGFRFPSQWVVEETYDTAAECKAARDQMQAKARDTIDRMEHDFMVKENIRDFDEGNEKFFEHYNPVVDMASSKSFAQCAASDDPRLAK
jgi:hypothetical protein